MLKFIRDNSEIIVKFILTHIVMSFLGIMVGLSILAFEGESEGMSMIAIIGSIFTIGFMCFMHYDDMYFSAAKDGIKHRAEGTAPDRFKGIKIILIAYLPVLISALVAIACDIFASNVENVSSVALFIYYALQGSFLALYKLREAIGVTGYVIITLIPAVLSAWLGYYLGSKDITLRSLFGINTKPPYDGPMERKPKNDK